MTAGEPGERAVEAPGVRREVFPLCRRCGQGDMVPLSISSGRGAAKHDKAWVCTNPTCGFSLKICNGEVYINEPVSDWLGLRGERGPVAGARRAAGPVPRSRTNGLGPSR